MRNEIFKANINPKVVEDLEEGCERVRYEDPIFNHHDQLDSFVQTLELEDPSKRESLVFEWVEPRIKKVLHLWSDRYSINSELIENVRLEKKSLEDIRKYNQRKLSSLEDNIIDNNLKIRELEKEKHKFDLEASSYGGGVHWGGEMTSVIFAMTITVLLAISTIYVYLDAQGQLWWNQQNLNQKVNLVALGFEKGIKDFDVYFYDQDDSNSERSNRPFRESVANITRLSLYQYIVLAGTSALLLGVAALVFIAIGKMLAAVYSRMGKPSWFFYAIVTMAVALMIMLIVIYLQIQAKSNDISSQEVQVKILEEQKNRIILFGNQTFGSEFDASNTENSASNETELDMKYSQASEKLSEMRTEFRNLDGWLKIIAFLAEMLIGAWAWITLADYQHKRVLQLGGAQGQVDHLTQRIESINEKNLKMQTEAKELSDDNNLISSLLPRLQALLSNIYSKEKISTISANFHDEEKSKAKEILQKYIFEWDRRNG